ncbi:MAG: dihydropteroate synthase [Candidatus Heimdallarchaeaceae archaeon]
MKIEGFIGKLKVGDSYPARIVGIINLSPASFYKGSIQTTKEDIAKVTQHMIEEGADCIDIGAQSTRPIQIYGGEGRVDAPTEREMVENALEITLDILSSYSEIELSVDTMRSEVAEVALKKGVRIINDISGFKKDEKVAHLIADYGASAVIMAAKVEPGDVFTIPDINSELSRSISIGTKAGIEENKICIDPGIGSWEARDYHHDYIILKNLEDFRKLNKPIYVGISRKTSIGKALDDAPPQERLYGSLGASIIALLNSAHIFRTHDVKATRDAIRVAEIIRRS